TQEWIEKPWYSEKPLEDAVTVFTDAGKKSMRAAATWKEAEIWRYHRIDAVKGDSLQMLELRAIVSVLGEIQGRVNVVSDSLYAVGVVQRIEQAHIKEVSNKEVLGQLLW
ncbi:PO113 protein, partial [Centropus bengalensis]|nr:PO113 protein [Centropus bengalensis]